MSEETGHWSVCWRLHCCTAGCSACCQSGGLVRLTLPERRWMLMHVRAADSWLVLQVLREDRLRVHLPNDCSAAGWKSSGHPGVQTWAGDSRPWLWWLLMETGRQRSEACDAGSAAQSVWHSLEESITSVAALWDQLERPFGAGWCHSSVTPLLLQNRNTWRED